MQHRVKTGFAWLVLAAFLFTGEAQAAAVVESVIGEAKAGPSDTTASAIAKDQKIESGTLVVTGPKSLVVLGFDDGQKMVLAENTQFRITGYSFDKDEPKKDHYAFSLLKGALRSITSLFTRRNPTAYAMRIPQATIGIRGTDYMIALVNPAFGQVISGQVSASNTPGTATFGPKTTFTIPSSSILGSVIPPSALPPNVASLFNQLSALTLGPGAGAGAGGATAAAEGTFNPAWLIIPAVVGAAVAGGGGGGDGGGGGTTGTTKP